MADRGRLTIPDAVYVFAALAVFGVLFPVFRTAIDSQAATLTRGEQLLALAVVPLMLLVMFLLYYVKATGGAGS
jgi:hypothetical protein